jgi:hypothetical protein
MKVHKNEAEGMLKHKGVRRRKEVGDDRMNK